MCDLVKQIRVMCDWNLPPPLPFSSHIWFSYIYSHLFTLIFHVCLISPISYWHVTRLSRHSYMLMNEWKNPHHSQSKVVCRTFLGLWVLKHSKIYITAGRQWLLKFPRRGRNTESYLLSGFGNGIFRGLERKSTSGRFATSQVWLCTWINFGSRQGKVNNWEFCKLKVTPIVCSF